MKLGLGTAQFGMHYGISNHIGKTTVDEVEEILRLAESHHLTVLDTAPLYGDSETVLGETLSHRDHAFQIVTKTINLSTEVMTSYLAHAMEKRFYQSLAALQQDNIYGLLVHHADDLLCEGGEYLYDRLQTLKQTGYLAKIGVSIYTEAQLERILDQYLIDLIQLPINVFDQRFLSQGYLQTLKAAKIEIHARSIFLQGLLLMPVASLPAYFYPLVPHIITYQDFLVRANLTPLQAALGFVMGIKEIDTLICGVNQASQLLQLLSIRAALAPEEFTAFQLEDARFLNPTQWKLT